MKAFFHSQNRKIFQFFQTSQDFATGIILVFYTITKDIKASRNISPILATEQNNSNIEHTTTSQEIMKNGKGSIVLEDGSEYEGDFKNGKRCGFGNLIWPSGAVYIGHWKNNKICGKGIVKKDDETYEGVFKNNLQDGPGVKKVAQKVLLEGNGKFFSEKVIKKFYVSGKIFFEIEKKIPKMREYYFDILIKMDR